MITGPPRGQSDRSDRGGSTPAEVIAAQSHSMRDKRSGLAEQVMPSAAHRAI